VTTYFLGEIRFSPDSVNPFLSLDWIRAFRSGFAVARLCSPINGPTAFCSLALPSAGIQVVVIPTGWSGQDVDATRGHLEEHNVTVLYTGLNEEFSTDHIAVFAIGDSDPDELRMRLFPHVRKLKVAYMEHTPSVALRDLFDIVIVTPARFPRRVKNVFHPGCFHDRTRKMGVSAVLKVGADGQSQWLPAMQMGSMTR
jgi:hypothetical protein